MHILFATVGSVPRMQRIMGWVMMFTCLHFGADGRRLEMEVGVKHSAAVRVNHKFEDDGAMGTKIEIQKEHDSLPALILEGQFPELANVEDDVSAPLDLSMKMGLTTAIYDCLKRKGDNKVAPLDNLPTGVWDKIILPQEQDPLSQGRLQDAKAGELKKMLYEVYKLGWFQKMFWDKISNWIFKFKSTRSRQEVEEEMEKIHRDSVEKIGYMKHTLRNNSINFEELKRGCLDEAVGRMRPKMRQVLNELRSGCTGECSKMGHVASKALTVAGSLSTAASSLADEFRCKETAQFCPEGTYCGCEIVSDAKKATKVGVVSGLLFTLFNVLTMGTAGFMAPGPTEFASAMVFVFAAKAKGCGCLVSACSWNKEEEACLPAFDGYSSNPAQSLFPAVGMKCSHEGEAGIGHIVHSLGEMQECRLMPCETQDIGKVGKRETSSYNCVAKLEDPIGSVGGRLQDFTEMFPAEIARSLSKRGLHANKQSNDFVRAAHFFKRAQDISPTGRTLVSHGNMRFKQSDFLRAEAEKYYEKVKELLSKAQEQAKEAAEGKSTSSTMFGGHGFGKAMEAAWEAQQEVKDRAEFKAAWQARTTRIVGQIQLVIRCADEQLEKLRAHLPNTPCAGLGAALQAAAGNANQATALLEKQHAPPALQLTEATDQFQETFAPLSNDTEEQLQDIPTTSDECPPDVFCPGGRVFGDVDYDAKSPKEQARALFNRGIELHGLDRSDEALRFCQQAAKKYPMEPASDWTHFYAWSHTDYLFYGNLLYLQSIKERGRAERLYQQASDMFQALPSEPAPLEVLEVAKAQEYGRHAAFRLALLQDPRRPLYAAVQFDSKKREYCEQDVNTAIMYREKGLAYMKDQWYTEAQEYFTSANRLYPNEDGDAFDLFLSAGVQLLLEKPAVALQMYKRIGFCRDFTGSRIWMAVSEETMNRAKDRYRRLGNNDGKDHKMFGSVEESQRDIQQMKEEVKRECKTMFETPLNDTQKQARVTIACHRSK